MAIYKRGNTWWIDFATPRGEHVKRSAQTGDKTEARGLYGWLKAEARRIQQLGERPEYPWDDVVYKLLQEQARKRMHGDDIAKLAWLQQFQGGCVLVVIARDEISSIDERKKAEASSATANRYLALVRAILRKAWLESLGRTGRPKVEPNRAWALGSGAT